MYRVGMFIRRTRTRSIGDSYFTFRLVRSERTGSKVRQRTLLNLGRHFEVAQSDWPALCRRIDELLAGQMPLPGDSPPALKSRAQHIAAQLLARGRVGTVSAPATHRGDVQHVDVDSLELLRPRSVGVEHLALWAMDQLGLRTRLEELGIGASLRAAAIGSIITRMARPGSDRATRRWLGERSALGELLGVDFATMGPMRLYRASDALMAHREAIEHHLFDRAMGLFDLHPTVTLYDLTNTYFEGEAGGQPKARRGHSQDKRTDCPLLTLGLVLDTSAFVRRSQVFVRMTIIERIGDADRDARVIEPVPEPALARENQRGQLVRRWPPGLDVPQAGNQCRSGRPQASPEFRPVVVRQAGCRYESLPHGDSRRFHEESRRSAGCQEAPFGARPTPAFANRSRRSLLQTHAPVSRAPSTVSSTDSSSPTLRNPRNTPPGTTMPSKGSRITFSPPSSPQKTSQRPVSATNVSSDPCEWSAAPLFGPALTKSMK